MTHSPPPGGDHCLSTPTVLGLLSCCGRCPNKTKQVDGSWRPAKACFCLRLPFDSNPFSHSTVQESRLRCIISSQHDRCFSSKRK
ncbi:hypothetical protein NPIL_154541 [Nephila pilipes]|uniref:Uncharacterized protein n=1 Tax=Nephila pilipes TaxID=299642 RepID=A0A8X6MW83_NEPPI|nr:hypothetical protein NPIL_154541 [Nephila pilipes]